MNTHQHYFTSQPAVTSRPVTARLRLPDLDVELVSDSGVFSYGEVDRGTELLLRTIPPPPHGDLLDLGCGYGVIATTLALRAPHARIHAIDVNHRALELTRENAQRLVAGNISVTTPEDVAPGLRFAALYSNPPVRIGKAPLHDLLSMWIDRLAPDGDAFLVVQRHLGSDSLAAWLAQRGHQVERLRSKGGYRVLRVHARS
jgi:16S rRNA (guanine1207-N2)-methyltransferase